MFSACVVISHDANTVLYYIFCQRLSSEAKMFIMFARVVSLILKHVKKCVMMSCVQHCDSGAYSM